MNSFGMQSFSMTKAKLFSFIKISNLFPFFVVSADHKEDEREINENVRLDDRSKVAFNWRRSR
jgi:hypothetical protein